MKASIILFEHIVALNQIPVNSVGEKRFFVILNTRLKRSPNLSAGIRHYFAVPLFVLRLPRGLNRAFIRGVFRRSFTQSEKSEFKRVNPVF